jgi:hypothetical protein
MNEGSVIGLTWRTGTAVLEAALIGGVVHLCKEQSSARRVFTGSCEQGMRARERRAV